MYNENMGGVDALNKKLNKNTQYNYASFNFIFMFRDIL